MPHHSPPGFALHTQSLTPLSCLFCSAFQRNPQLHKAETDPRCRRPLLPSNSATLGQRQQPEGREPGVLLSGALPAQPPPPAAGPDAGGCGGGQWWGWQPGQLRQRPQRPQPLAVPATCAGGEGGRLAHAPEEQPRQGQVRAGWVQWDWAVSHWHPWERW